MAIIAGELAGGVLIGLLLGFAGVALMRRVALPASGLYPLAILAVAVLAYAGAASVHTSGFAAVYVAALVLGNGDLPHRAATRSFSEGLAWLAQIGLFVMLGLLASPGRIDLRTVLLAVVAGFVLTFVVRPVSVLISSVVQPMPLARAGLHQLGRAARRRADRADHDPALRRGSGTPRGSSTWSSCSRSSTPWSPARRLPFVARVLRVARRSEPRDLDVEAAPLERIAADLLQITISPRSRLHGVEVGELRLPTGASVALLVRDGRTLTPEARTVLRRGDDVLVVTPRKQREATERRLRSISLGGRLAQWLGDDRRTDQSSIRSSPATIAIEVRSPSSSTSSNPPAPP